MANPNPALMKKVRKVLEMRADTPDLTLALEDLSEFYGQNTLGNRRNLRSLVECRGIEISKSLVKAFSEVVEQLDKVDADVQVLANTCDVMKSKIKESQFSTVKLITISERLAQKEKTAEAQMILSSALLEKLRLTEEESHIICMQPVSTKFFQVLEKLEQLQMDCKNVLRTHHKRALLELMDEMALVHDTAYERLYQWLLDEIRAMEGEVTDMQPLIQKGMHALRNQSALFEMCVEEISATRHLAILKRFIDALTIGGPNGVPRPIEIHAHEPLRYVGDMLAWLHQALASESDLLCSIFGRQRGSPSRDVDTVLDHAFQGTCRPFQARLDQVLANQSNVVVAFKLSNLLQFYLQTIGQLLPADAVLTTTLLQCSSAAFGAFRSFLSKSAEKLDRQPLSCPADLSPPHLVTESLDELTEILTSFDSSLVPAKMRESTFRPVIEATVDPLLSACALASHALTAEEAAVFLTNVAFVTKSALEGYEFAQWRVDLLVANVKAYTDAIVREQLNTILRRCSLDDKIRVLYAVQQAEGRLCDAPGMDHLSLALAFKQLYSMLFNPLSLPMPICDRLIDPELRRNCRSQVANALSEIYDRFYDAIMDPVGGYSNPNAFLTHDKDQIRLLLTNSS